QDEKFVQDINFQLTVEDTIFPMIKSVYSINQSNILIRFSEAILDFNESNPQNYFKIALESDTTRQLKITSCYKNALDPSNIFLSIEKQSAISYQLIAQNLLDQSHNHLDCSNNSVVFEGTIEPDTVQPTIIYRSIQDSSTGISLNPEIRFGFSEAIGQYSFENSFVLRESDTSLVSGKFHWKNPADVSFSVDSSLKSLTEYSIHLSVDSVVDLAGNSLADSVDTLYFKTLNADTLSAIGGEIVDEQANARGKIFLTAKSEQNFYQLILEKPGAYLFDNVMPGIYMINGFRDADSNGVYSYGKTIPYVPAERFFFYSDSIKVRSRWPNEGNNITFK
ncbi:MAG: Ig-like domain-containing protein, partial [bacterium]